LSGRRQSDATVRPTTFVRSAAGEQREDPGPFVQRKDDTEEAIQRRLDVYRPGPSKDYYNEQGLLVTVDATKPIPEVTDGVLGL